MNPDANFADVHNLGICKANLRPGYIPVTPEEAARIVVNDIIQNTTRLEQVLAARDKFPEGIIPYWAGVRACNAAYGMKEGGPAAMVVDEPLRKTVLDPLGIQAMPSDKFPFFSVESTIHHIGRLVLELEEISSTNSLCYRNVRRQSIN